MGVRGTFKGAVKDNGLILHYDAGKVDSYNRSGLVINDLSESKTTGGLTGSTIRWSNSNGGIIIFDGTSNQINLGTPTSLQFVNTQPFSVSIWFKWTEASAVFGSLVTYAGASTLGWYIGLDASGTLVPPAVNVAYCDYWAGGAPYRGIYTASNSILKNTWVNLTFTNDSTNTVAGMKFYINGTLATTQVRNSSQPSSINYTGINAQIGSRGSDNTTRFEGNISQVLIYNRELTASEVLQNYTNFRGRISLRGIDSDADTFLKAAHIEDDTQAMAVNNLVLDLKKFGLWTKMKAIYPVVGRNAWSHAVNLKTPGTYNLTFNGTWTHGSTGMTPSTSYADTNFNPTSNSQTSQNWHVSYYSRNNVSNGGSLFGGLNITHGPILNQSGSFYLDWPGFANVSSPAPGRISSDTNASLLNIATNAMFIFNATSANVKVFRNNTTLVTGSSISTSVPNQNIFLNLGYTSNTPRYDSRQCSFASIGDGLTDTEAANFYIAVQTFQTMLGRQV